MRFDYAAGAGLDAANSAEADIRFAQTVIGAENLKNEVVRSIQGFAAEHPNTAEGIKAFVNTATVGYGAAKGVGAAKAAKAGKADVSMDFADAYRARQGADVPYDSSGIKTGQKQRYGKNGVTPSTGHQVGATSSNVKRPNWRDSESDVGKNYPNYDYQKSFQDGNEVPYGTKGSVRPEYYTKGHSVEVKNYNIETSSGRNNLINNVSNQVKQRTTDLPEGTKQTIVIAIRGRMLVMIL